MVQAADFGKLHDPPRRGELDRPEVGCILVERNGATKATVSAPMVQTVVALTLLVIVIRVVAPSLLPQIIELIRAIKQ